MIAVTSLDINIVITVEAEALSITNNQDPSWYGLALSSDPNNGYPEYAGATLTNGTVTYASSLDPSLISLNFQYYYPAGVTNLPILMVIHAYEGQVTDIDVATMQRLARYGYFVFAPEMRGSAGNYSTYGGSRDAAGREIDDCYDAYQYVKNNFAGIVSDQGQRVSVLGFSAGGGDTYALACRYPDTFQSVTVMFGISDYGVDSTYGWYNQQPSRQASLQSYIGGTPAAKANEYAARYTKTAIAANHQGFISIFHDTADASVGVDHSQRVVAMYVAAGNSNYYYNESTVGSTYRWSHGYPGTFPDLIQAEPYWKYRPKTGGIVKVPASGTLKIIGKVNTKRFKVHLNDGDWRNMGRCRTADLTYDHDANTYTLTNLLTGSVAVVETDTGLIGVGISSGTSLSITPVSPLFAGFKPASRFNVNANRLIKDGSNNISLWCDAVGGNRAQGFSWTVPGTAPNYVASELNSLPGIGLNGTTQYFQGLGNIDAFRQKRGFTVFTVSKGAIFSQGNASTSVIQIFTLVAGATNFSVFANGVASNVSYASTNAYKVRTMVYDGTQVSNTNRILEREDKVTKSLTLSGTTDTITCDIAADVVTIGKRCYDASFFGGNWVDCLIFDWPMNATQYGAVEDALKTLYGI